MAGYTLMYWNLLDLIFLAFRYTSCFVRCFLYLHLHHYLISDPHHISTPRPS